MKYLILIVLMLVVLSFTLPPSLSTQAQAQANPSFLTYTNTELGFTMKYPSDWTVDESEITNNKTVKFRSADSVGEIQVRIQNITLEGTGPTTDDVANYLTSHPVAGQKLLQVDKNGYFLSGHPALRVIFSKSFETAPPEIKTMDYILPIGEKLYYVIYGSTPERFPTNLQTAQSMIDSFQIISKQ